MLKSHSVGALNTYCVIDVLHIAANGGQMSLADFKKENKKMNEDSRYNIISFGLTKDDTLYVIQWEPAAPGNYSLWLAEGRPDNMEQKEVEEYMRVYGADGCSITGIFTDVMDELREVI